MDQLEPIGYAVGAAQDTTWNLRRIRAAPAAWSVGTGNGVGLLIIDTGADSTHSDLDLQSLTVCGEASALDPDGHGTYVTGIAAATDNGFGVVGAAYGSDLHVWAAADTLLDPDGELVGTLMSEACIEEAVDWARTSGIVFGVNMSLHIETPEATLTDAIKGAYGSGVLFVAAAGNNGTISYPAIMDEVIAVTATDANDSATWSGAVVHSQVELAAPGINIKSTCTGNAYCNLTPDQVGTSYASPQVAAGTVIIKELNPTWSNEQVREHLQNTARDLGPSGKDDRYGYGLLVSLDEANVLAAVESLEALGYRPTLPVEARDFADRSTREQWVRERNLEVFSLTSDRHPETTVDIFAREPFDFEAEFEKAMVAEVAEDLRGPLRQPPDAAGNEGVHGAPAGPGRREAPPRDPGDELMASSPDDWESATFDGARRAQLRRSLRLTVRERLQALEELVETSRRLAELGEKVRRTSGR